MGVSATVYAQEEKLDFDTPCRRYQREVGLVAIVVLVTICSSHVRR
jgi:hypothetical protein